MIKNINDLMTRYEKEKINIQKRSGEIVSEHKEILVCAGTGCMSSKSLQIIENLKEAVADHNLDVNVHGTGCFGFCGQGPIIKVQPDNVFYVKVKLTDIDEI